MYFFLLSEELITNNMAIPVTPGSGAASVATETVGGLNYQQIEVLGKGGASVLAVNPDGSSNVSILGTPTFTVSGNASVSGTVGASVIGKVPVELSNASVITKVQSSVAVAIISGSVAVATGNSSVQVLNFPTNQNVSGSVVGFQGTNPWIITGSIQGTLNTGNSSVQVLNFPTSQNVNGSVVATQGTSPWIITGSVQTAVTTGNSSVQVLNFPTTQNVSGSVVATQGTNPWIITGSVQGAFSPSGNQSVSGTVQTDVRGSVATVIIGGSIAASFTPPANQSVSGTVQTDVRGSVAVAIISGSIAATFTPPANQSVSGTVTANQGTSPWIITGSVQTAVSTGNSSVQVLNFPTTQNVSGSVVASQGTTPWVITGSVQGATSPANQSVSGTVGASVIGTVPTTQSGTRITSIVGSYTEPAVVTSITGVALVYKSNVSTSVMTGVSVANPLPVSVQGTVNIGTGGPVSVTGTMSVLGTVPVTIVSGSIAAIQSPGNSSTITVGQGSVAVAIISGSVAVATGNSSVQVLNFPTTQNISGSVVTFQGGQVSTSITGTLTIGAITSGASVFGNASVFQAGTWNVSVATANISSISTANGGLPLWSPLGSRLQGTADLRVVQGGSVAVIAAQGSGVFTYIDRVQIANYGPSSVLVTIADNTTSILGYTIAPAGGGSNYNAFYKSAANSPVTASINGTASVLVSMQGFKSAT